MDKRQRRKTRLRQAIALLSSGGVLCGSALAGSALYDFNSALPPELKAVGSSTTDPNTGAFIQYPEWRSSGGVNNSGYVSLFDSVDSMYAAMLIPDFDEGLVVKAFTFEVDLRVGNATGESGRPADGFSISYARADDPVVQDLDQDFPVYNGNNFSLAGAPENGTRTGLVISFDAWSGNTQPDGGADIEGIMINVDGRVVPVNGQRGIPMNTRNGACDDPTSMQTGSWTGLGEGAGPSPVDGLCWAPLKVEVNDQGQITVTWKGTVIADRVPSGFSPAPGRIVFAGRTGGANQNVHIDNLRITTVAADTVIVGAVTGNPVGFRVLLTDSGPAVVDPNGIELKLDGETVTRSEISKTGVNTTVGFFDVTKPLAPGSTHSVEITVRDARGTSVTETRTFTVPAYVTLPPEYAVAGTSQPGFNVTVHQTAARNQENTVARAEQQLQGLRGANVADLTGFTGGVYAETGVINYSQLSAAGLPEAAGFFQESSGFPDASIPGIPSATEVNPDGTIYTDNIAAKIVTYLQFPEAGVYDLIFNSDDGFRTTAFKGSEEVLSSILVGQADVGRGAEDTRSTVYVPQAGAYPFRTVWFEGGGGANLEWGVEQTAPRTGARALINDTASPVKAFRSASTASPAVVTFTHPFRTSGNPYLPTIPLIAKVQDGPTAVDQNSIKLFLNGTELTATKAKVGNVTTATHRPAAPLPAGDHVFKVTFTADGADYEGSTTFTIRNVPTVPPSFALPAASVITANGGFLVKTVQNANYQDLGTRGTDTYAAESQINGLLGLPNTANPSVFTGPGGYYVETDVINYFSTGDDGYFDTGTMYPDWPVPGIPGIDPRGSGAFPEATDFPDTGTDGYSQEILTVLNLQPGTYAMNVNSDDGFRCYFGNPKEWWTLPLVVGEFDGGRGAAGGIGDGTFFYFRILQAGLYPVRLLWYEGGGGSSAEWSSRALDPETGHLGAATLINDYQVTNSIKAYQYPLNSPGSPYVKFFAPGRDRTSAASQARASNDAMIHVVIEQGTANLDAGSVSLTVDGTAVTPTATKTGSELTVHYAPTTPWADGLHTAVLTYGDRTVSWSFRTGSPFKTPTFFIEAEDFDNNGQGVAAASQMPYMGGAYAGLKAVVGTDYERASEAASPLYRHGVNPQVAMDRTGDRNRGLVDIAVNYKLGWIGGGQWYNYTRDIPAGKYNAYAAISHGESNPNQLSATLQRVTGGTASDLGVFSAPGTGGWGNNALVPLKTAADGDLVELDLGGRTTLRYASNSGDWDFLLLVPAAATPTQPEITGIRRNADGTVTIEWVGGGTLQAAPTVTGGWQDVPGATSPYTFTPDQAMLFGRIRQ